MFQIEEELKKLPGKPGVYIMHGEKDEIIYVGKAVSLKNRVRQYFQSSRNKGAKIEQMVTHITRFEYIITDSELEALVLECNLIKEHRPKYNTMLKDDKSYPFIKVTVNEEYPRVLFARRMKKDKAKYFGPYTSAGAVKDVIELVRKLYKVRSCNRVLPRDCGKDRPCLYHHMKQCSAPCQGYVSSEEYKKNIAELLKFLNGDFKDTIDMLTDKMMAASEEMRFEDAMEYRDLIRSIQKIGERQKITGYGEEDKDIIAVAMDESLDLREQDAVVQVFFVRGGKLIGREHFYLRVARGDTKAQVLSSFMKQFYAGTPFIPREIMLQKEIEDAKIIEEWLTDRRKQRVYIRVPKKGTKEKLVELAEENAKMVLDKDRERIKREEGRTIGAVHEVEEWLGLSGIRRMEAYDISNISGFESVGSMVVYEKGKPKRSDYRKFKIKWVQGPNDYASMEEVLTRRFTHEGKDEFDSFSIMPDLILMDGGRGQVNIALGPVLEIWHDYRERFENAAEGTLPPKEELEQANLLTDLQKVQLDEEAQTVFLTEKGMSLDVGALAKGYATEKVGEELFNMGFTSFSISGGGNVRTFSEPVDSERKKWNISIMNPNTAEDPNAEPIDFLYVNDLFYYFLFCSHLGEFFYGYPRQTNKKAPYGKRLFSKKASRHGGNCNDPPSGL